jgi:hypothetical protein|tara:strand:+ start:191 stop:466 length:276 start_codon:yes stop_codon:yes gene_type:complete
MSKTTLLKSNCTEWREFASKIDNILQDMVTIDAAGNPVEQGSMYFDDAVKKITSSQLDILGSPTYPINEFVAKELVKIEVERRNLEFMENA